MDSTKEIIAQVVSKLVESQLASQNLEVLNSMTEIKENQLDILTKLNQISYTSKSCNNLKDLLHLVSSINVQDIRAHPITPVEINEEELIKIRNGCNAYYVSKDYTDLLSSIVGKEMLYFQLLVALYPNLFELLQPYVERACCSSE